MTDSEWTVPAPARRWPERVAPERLALEQWLDYQRATLVSKCAGLGAEQLKRREELGFAYDPDQVGSDFDDLEGADPAANLDAFYEEVDAARAAVAGKSLDLVVESRGDHPERTMDLRWIFCHMIEEYARHNGHADLLREAIDGVTGD